MKRRCGAARFNQTNPAFGPVQGGGPTIWMGGTGPTIFNDKLFVVTGECPARLQRQASAMLMPSVSVVLFWYCLVPSVFGAQHPWLLLSALRGLRYA